MPVQSQSFESERSNLCENKIEIERVWEIGVTGEDESCGGSEEAEERSGFVAAEGRRSHVCVCLVAGIGCVRKSGVWMKKIKLCCCLMYEILWLLDFYERERRERVESEEDGWFWFRVAHGLRSIFFFFGHVFKLTF